MTDNKWTFEFLRTANEKAQGLQFRESIPNNHVLVFEDCKEGDGFHSMNCYFPFDIIFLDQHNRVLKSFTMYPPNDLISCPQNTSRVLEAEVGWLDSNKLQVGDSIDLGEN